MFHIATSGRRPCAWLARLRACAVSLLVAPALAQAAADPQIAALLSTPDPVAAGGLYSYQIRVDNNATDAATSTRLLLKVPAGASFVSASPAGANCAPVPTAPTTDIECNLGTLGGLGADPRNISFTWRALGPGPTSISATAEVFADSDGNSTNNTESKITTVNSGADMALTLTDAPDPVVGGAAISYTLRVSNGGPNVSGNIVVTNNLPPAVTFGSASGTGWTCSHSAGVVTCTRSASIAVAATAPNITITGTVTAGGGNITNSATVAPAASGSVAEPENANNTATVDTAVLPGADVRIATKVVTSASPAVAGSNVTYRIDPRNSGPSTATAVVVSDPLPAGWAFVSATGPNWSCSFSAPNVSCTRATMSVGATDNITLVATAPDTATVGPTGTNYNNTASIAASSTDPVAGNNSASRSLLVLPDGANLSLSKSKTPNPVALGSNMVSTIRVTNNGPRVATGPLRVVESLSGENFVSASGTGWTCAPAGAVVQCDHANTGGLAVAASLPNLLITTTATSNGGVSNTACTGSSVPAAGGNPSPPIEGDPNPGNDCITATANSTSTIPDLAISKTTSTPTGGDKTVSTSEGSVTYTLVVSNVAAGQPATGVRITDTVPAWINGRSSLASPITAVVSGGTATFNCTNSAAAVTCTQTAGQLLAGETVTVPITVNRPLLDGSFTNTANVGNTVEGDPNSSNNSASDSVVIEPIADVEMTGKTATPAAVRAGEESTFVLSFRNNGPSSALGVVISDSITFTGGDSGLTVLSISSTKSGSSCSIAAGGLLTPASPSFNCTIGSLNNGESQSVTLVVRPNFLAGNATRTFNNTATVTTTSVENPAGGDNGNNSQSAVLNVNPAALDLLVDKTDLVDPVAYAAGASFISYQVRVTNNGPSFGTNVRVTETMTPPAAKRIRFVCDTTSYGGSTCNSTPLCTVSNVTSGAGAAIPTFQCAVPAGNATSGPAIGELASGQSKFIYLRAEVLDQPEPAGDVYNNAVTVIANEPDSFATNDSANAFTTLRQRIDLRTTKVASVASPTLQQPFNWTITVVNNGPGNSLQTDLTDALPAGVQVTGAINWTRTLPAGSGTCTLAGQNMSCALGQLDATGAVTITVPVRITSYPSGGTMINTATVDNSPAKTGGVDTPGGNNAGSSTITVTRSSLTGTVFEDRDRTGVNGGVPQAAGSEPRISGVTITLTGTDAYGTAISRTATSDANGNYSFSNLAPSNASGYTLTQTQPAAYVNGPIDPPATGASAPTDGGTFAGGGGSGNSSWTAVVLGGNNAGLRYNFPEVRKPTLSGFVYIDANVNGVRDAATDPAIAGATVRLLNAGTLALVATATTNASGAYSFSGLDPLISYTLEQSLPASPANLANGPVNPGLVGGAACAAGCTAQPDTPAVNTDRIASIDLSSGVDGTVFNFGERQQTTVGGTVYIDRNRDNLLDPTPTDGRIAGVTLRLVQGADCSSGTTLQTTTTDVNGTYSFTGVIAGANYLVCQTQPVAYANGVENPGPAASTPGANVITITALPPGGSTTNHFGERIGALAGSVYADISPATPAQTDNGLRDAGEAGITNVPVTLTGSDILGNPVNRSTTTDASGNYRFDDLLAADASGYTLTEGTIPPASGSFNDGRERVGSAGGSAAVNDVISAIPLGAGLQGSNYDFGELPVATITGTVYIDRNRDNLLDATPTDGRIPGVTLSLVSGAGCAGPALATTTTAASGNYSFSGVSAGLSYTLCQTQPAGYGDGGVNPGTSGSSNAANAITLSNLPAGGSAANHFGERIGSLAGAVYADSSPATPANSDNGLRDAGESGIANVPVTLSGRDILGNPVNRSTTTDASGNYRFDELLASDGTGYSLSEGTIPPASGSFNDGRDRVGSAGGSAAVNDVVSAIVLGAGVQGSNYDFGELPIAAISGTVYIDRNRDNLIDASPTDGRIANVTMRLVQGANCSSGTTLQTTSTDASGNYSFASVIAGASYLVCQTQPVAYANGVENPGTAASTPGANVIAISLLPTGGSTANQFGERIGSLSGSVYADFSAATPASTDNGVRDAGETGIVNVPVTLTGRDILGNPVNRSTTTDASGNYRFDELLASDGTGYTLSEGTIPPASGSFNDGRERVGSAGGSAAVNDVVSAIPLAAGLQGGNYDFAELPIAPITGTVYIDRNRDNLLDATPPDGRITGVTLNLVLGGSCAGPVVAITTTQAGGGYSFSGASAGLTYTLCQTQPAGYADGGVNPGTSGSSAAANAITISNLPATGSAGNHFGERVGALTGSVYADLSAATPANTNNGVRDAGEPGIANVPVTLSGRDIAGNAVSRSTTTDASGNYRFDDLLAADASGYTLTEGTIPPASGSFNDGLDRVGSAGGSAAINDVISAIVLSAGVQGSNYDFGELSSTAISGTVYIDRNRDNLLDLTPTDGRITGVTLNLVSGGSCAGPVVASTITDASGNYSFSGASAGLTYTLCQTQPAGYADGGVNPGANGSSSTANAITLSNLPAGGSTGNHFAERVASLAGSVYQDGDNNGLRGSAESGFAGIVITLSGNDVIGNPVSRAATTDSSGNYRFDDLLAAGPAGYTLTEQSAQPVSGAITTLNGRTTAGTSGGSITLVTTTPSAISAIALAAGADATANHFGELLPVAISGLVFIDIDNNGLQNLPADTGLGGVSIVVIGTDDTAAAVSHTVSTQPDGSYSLTGLRPGTYTITQPTQPAGTSNGQTLPGSAGGGATGINTVPSAISTVVLTTPGTSATDNNFAEIANNSAISGRIWLDNNNDGLIGSNETGIAGITVELTGTDTAARPVSRSTTTDANGAYSFSALAPGSYTVTEPTQPASTLNGRTNAGSAGGTATPVATTPSAISTITLAVGATSTGNNFGELPLGAVAGRVYADNNDNGLIDAGETGLAGVNLVLTGTDDLGNAVTATAITDADGAYRFDGLRPGTYIVTEPTQPAGTVNGRTTAGSLGGTATPPAVAPSAISAIVLPPGGLSLGNLFGELGNSPDLRVSKRHVEDRFTVSHTGRYLISVRNAGEVASSGPYTVSDRLPAGLTLAAQPSGSGWVCGGAVGDTRFDCSTSAVIAAGASRADAISVLVHVAAAAAAASPVNNLVLVDGGGEIDARRPSAADRDAFLNNPGVLPECSATVNHNACRTPTPVQLAASISGTVWYDKGSSPRVLDGGDRRLPGWGVEVIDTASGAIVGRATTGVDGSYRIADLIPGIALAVRFRDPDSGVIFGYPVNGEAGPGSSGTSCNPAAPLGSASSCLARGANPTLSVVLAPGQDLPQQSLPVDPNGVVYDSGTRSPVPGTVVTMAPVGNCPGWNPATSIVGATLGGYTINGDGIAMTVGADGFYQYLFAPSAPASCNFSLVLTPPAGYLFPSLLIPPATGPLQPTGGPNAVFPVQPQATAPTAPVGTGTLYYLLLNSGSGGANIVNNHLPVDLAAPSAISLSKTGNRQLVEIGDSLRYSITVQVMAGALPRQTTVVDRLPAGFTYIAGTAMVGSQPIADPQGGVGPTLAFHLGAMPASRQLVLHYRVRIGVGADSGDGINRAVGHACGVPAGCVGPDFSPLPGSATTNEGRFQVRVAGGVFGSDACVLGKIFVDCNGNHVQDSEELGIPGVRLVMQDGSTLISDSEGKYSLCGLPPKSHVLKVDSVTLPLGARLTTSSNRNLGDAGSLWLDLKNGELHRADFIEGSCSNPVLDQVKARRAQGEVRAPETEKGPALRFDSKAHGLNPQSTPQQGTDGANQLVPRPRTPASGAAGGQDATR